MCYLPRLKLLIADALALVSLLGKAIGTELRDRLIRLGRCKYEMHVSFFPVCLVAQLTF